MITLLILVSLTPISGVVSGGRETAFSMEEGLLPLLLWKYEPSIPTDRSGTFTEIVFHSLGKQSFRVVSSGETAGIHPLAASNIRENGYTFMASAGDILAYGIRREQTASHALSYKNVTVDFRGTPFEDVHAAGEYRDSLFLIAAASNASVFAISFPFGDDFRAGPVYLRRRQEGELWLRAKASFGPFCVVSFPAIDENTCYRRAYGTVKLDRAQLVYGWNGVNQFARLLLSTGRLRTELTMQEPGATIVYRPMDNLLLIASCSEGGWFQSEIQSEFHGIVAGADIIRYPGGSFGCGVCAGIAMGSNTIDQQLQIEHPWISENAVSSFKY